MYNTERPTRAELPSSKQLIRSTFIAVLTAIVLLTTVVLPAEYGIDPTGIGNLIGLKRMGEIKVTLTKEATKPDVQPSAQAALAATADVASLPQAAELAIKQADVSASTASAASSTTAEKKDEIAFTLKPGEAAEFKLAMSQGAKVWYQWVVRGGAVNFDAHGDPIKPPKGFYHGYGKGKQSMGDQGVLVAAFDGHHGWFWRNRSTENATITLTTEGNYSELKRAL
jgi:hypothetical protein